MVDEIPASISNDKIIDYIAGRTNTKFEKELQKLHDEQEEQTLLNNQLILENNTIKKKWKHLEQERNKFEKDYEHYFD